MLAIVTLSLAALCAALLLTLLVILLRRPAAATPQQLDALRQSLEEEMRQSRTETNNATANMLRTINESQLAASKAASENQNMRLTSMQSQFLLMEQRLGTSAAESEKRLEAIRSTMETRITSLQAENTKSLELMRQTVDEKLQKTLDEKLKQSFQMVSAQLEQVYKGLGEMQSLAAGVGDLKKVLSNVKTRGILGEIQLGAILEEILSPEQYVTNFVPRPGRSDPVEYCIKLPGDGESPVYLPIDAKFPSDLYMRLMEAYDSGDAIRIETAGKELEQRIRSCAKDIHDKYVEPPYTTDFAILFLPTEGLYAEVVRRGMVERLQHEFKVNIAGPSNMAALLNSLQMGFRTLAIQKRSGEVWKVLAGVKTEFDTFGEVLVSAQNRIKQADDELEKLLGVRTRQIQRRLSQVQTLGEDGEGAVPGGPVLPPLP